MHISTSREVPSDVDKKAMFEHLRNAGKALKLPDHIFRTAEILICYIPKDAPAPISPARIQDIADERGISVRAVRYHIQRLIALGLVRDATIGGGHRTIRRRNGRIVSIAGVDFGPMLARRDELAASAALQQAEVDEGIALRTEISRLRRRVGLCASSSDSSMASDMLDQLGTLPRRYDRLSLHELANLRDRLQRLLACLVDLAADDTLDAAGIADKSAIQCRPNSTKDSENPVVPPLPVLLDHLPSDWHAEIDASGQRNWTSLIATAYTRSVALAVPQTLWDDVSRDLGRRAAAVLVLVADARSTGRGGTIRSPAAWLSHMAARAQSEPIDLTRNLISIKAGSTPGRCNSLKYRGGFNLRAKCDRLQSEFSIPCEQGW